MIKIVSAQLKRIPFCFIATALLATSTFYLHGSALSGFWRFDDPQALDFVLYQSLSGAFYQPDIWHKINMPFFTPLLTLSYGLDIKIVGLMPYWFYFHHLVSLFLAAWMTYIFLLRWIPAMWALLGSMLFLSGLPVTVVAQQLMTRHYIEGLIFAIIAVHFFLKSVEGYRWLGWVGALCYLIAVMAKEVYAPLIFLLFMLDRNSDSDKLVKWKRITPYLLVAIIYAPWRTYMLGGIGGYGPLLLPSLDNAKQFIVAIRYWIFADNVLGVAACCLTIALFLIAVKSKAIKPLPVVISIVLLIAPLLPIMATLPVRIMTEYFIAHRYMFLPWWALSCGLVLALAKIDAPKKSCAVIANQTKNSFFWKRILLALSYLLIFKAASQQQGKLCFGELIAENEKIYKIAWLSDKSQNIIIPREFDSYIRFMFSQIADIRKIPFEQMPNVNSIEYFFHENFSKWNYPQQTCMSRLGEHRN